ncbi:MAG: haloalkane dehalogenase [Actinomycetota bacterium]
MDRQHVDVLDGQMAYVEAGLGAETIVFLHGNPTSSFLWRNVLPHVTDLGRCLAPDLIGMGESSKRAGEGDDRYRFVEHVRYLDAWFDSVVPEGQVILVVHDWGSALGFHWANRHRDRVRGIAYTEAIVSPVEWDEWPEAARGIFEAFRSPAGEELVLDKNVFVENVLTAGDPPFLDEAAMEVYRAPFAEPGEDRRPTLTWPRQIPLAGEPADVVAIVEDYGRWLAESDVPKLLVHADPGAILIGRQLELARSWPNQTEVSVAGGHFVQEFSPHELGEHLRDWVQGLDG